MFLLPPSRRTTEGTTTAAGRCLLHAQPISPPHLTWSPPIPRLSCWPPGRDGLVPAGRVPPLLSQRASMQTLAFPAFQGKPRRPGAVEIHRLAEEVGGTRYRYFVAVLKYRFQVFPRDSSLLLSAFVHRCTLVVLTNFSKKKYAFQKNKQNKYVKIC